MLYFRKICLLATLVLTFGVSDLFSQTLAPPSGISVRIVQPADSAWVGSNGKIVVEVHSQTLLSGIRADDREDIAFVQGIGPGTIEEVGLVIDSRTDRDDPVHMGSRLTSLGNAPSVLAIADTVDLSICAVNQFVGSPTVSDNMRSVTWDLTNCEVTGTIQSSGSSNIHTARYTFTIKPTLGTLTVGSKTANFRGGVSGVYAYTSARVGTGPTAEGWRAIANVERGGDGKFVRVDTGRPIQRDSHFDSVVVAGKADGAMFKIDDKIEAVAKINNLIGARDAVAIELGLFAFDGDYLDDPDYQTERDSALVGSLTRFEIKDGNIQGASNQFLRKTVTVEENAFKIVGDNPSTDPNADTYDGGTHETILMDNLRFKVAVFFVDRAGNIGAATADAANPAPFSQARTYIVDSKRPVIKIKHPVAVDDPDSNRFTSRIERSFANYRNNDGSTGLNDVPHRPLRVNVQEALGSLRATIVTPKDSMAHADITSRYTDIGSDENIATHNLFKTAGNRILPSSTKGGQKVDLMIVAQDMVGNKSTMTVKGVIHDEDDPGTTNLFPEMADLAENKINEETRHPLVKFNEALDSLSVRFVQNIGNNPHRAVQEADAGLLSIVNKDYTVTVNDSLRDGLTYFFQLFARDLAGNVYVSRGDTLTFEKSFRNPPANMFVVETTNGDSAIANKPLNVKITAVDSVQRRINRNRGKAVTHRKDVRLSAWDGDEMATSVTFTGAGASKNEDGSFNVPGDRWNAGELTGVQAKSTKVLDNFSILVEDVTTTDVDGVPTTTVNISGKKAGLYVDADRMTKFVVTAWEDGEEAKTVSGEFGVNVKPTDKFGNPSIKTGNSNNDLLDTRDPSTFKNFSVVLSANHPAASVPGPQLMTLAGKTFTVVAPNGNGTGLTITAAVDNAPPGSTSPHLIAKGTVTVAYSAVAPTAADSLAAPASLMVMDVPDDQGHRVAVTYTLSADHAMVDRYRLYREMDLGDGQGMRFIQWGQDREPATDSLDTYVVGVPDGMATRWAIQAIGNKPSSPTVSGKLSAVAPRSLLTKTADPVAALDNIPPGAATDVMLDGLTVSWTMSPDEGPTGVTYTNTWTGQAGIAIPGVTGYDILVGLSAEAMNSVGKVKAGESSFDLSVEAITPLIVAGVITQEQLTELLANDLLGVMVRVDALDASNSVPSMIFTVEKLTRREFTSADGDPVYLIAEGDMTVGFDDFMAFAAAFDTRDGDDAWNVQADLNDDGTVDFADFILFVGSYGKTAQGPSTKPVILPPGVNENAEFSLRLGSERVVVGQNVFVDVSLANVQALMGYGFVLNYDADKFEFVEAAPTDQDLLKSTGGETPLFSSIANGSGQVSIANAVVNGSEITGGGDIVRLTFRVLQEFEENARFEIAEGLVFDPQQLSNPAVVAGVLDVQTTPTEFALLQNFPNPFNPETTIGYELAESADVTLQIYNVVGQVVRTLIAAESQAAGRYQIRWNGMDDRGVPVSSGVYFYQISAGEFQTVRKLMLLK